MALRRWSKVLSVSRKSLKEFFFWIIDEAIKRSFCYTCIDIWSTFSRFVIIYWKYVYMYTYIYICIQFFGITELLLKLETSIIAFWVPTWYCCRCWQVQLLVGGGGMSQDEYVSLNMRSDQSWLVYIYTYVHTYTSMYNTWLTCVYLCIMYVIHVLSIYIHTDRVGIY